MDVGLLFVGQSGKCRLVHEAKVDQPGEHVGHRRAALVDLGDAQVRLRYVNCPFAPFLDTSTQNVCAGL